MAAPAVFLLYSLQPSRKTANSELTPIVVRIVFRHSAGVTQLVECNLAKVDVEGSSPFTRSNSPPSLGRVGLVNRTIFSV